MLGATAVNGTEPSLAILDELDYLRIYNKEQLEELWESVKPQINDMFKNYKPYIVALGIINGVELFQVNGNDNFFYVTDKEGAIAAVKALRKAAENYGTNK